MAFLWNGWPDLFRQSLRLPQEIQTCQNLCLLANLAIIQNSILIQISRYYLTGNSLDKYFARRFPSAIIVNVGGKPQDSGTTEQSHT